MGIGVPSVQVDGKVPLPCSWKKEGGVTGCRDDKTGEDGEAGPSRVWTIPGLWLCLRCKNMKQRDFNRDNDLHRYVKVGLIKTDREATP